MQNFFFCGGEGGGGGLGIDKISNHCKSGHDLESIGKFNWWYEDLCDGVYRLLLRLVWYT